MIATGVSVCSPSSPSFHSSLRPSPTSEFLPDPPTTAPPNGGHCPREAYSELQSHVRPAAEAPPPPVGRLRRRAEGAATCCRSALSLSPLSAIQAAPFVEFSLQIIEQVILAPIGTLNWSGRRSPFEEATGCRRDKSVGLTAHLLALDRAESSEQIRWCELVVCQLELATNNNNSSGPMRRTVWVVE